MGRSSRIMVNRRSLLKTGVMSGVALALSGLNIKDVQAVTTYCGLDSWSTICCSMPLNFYIGRGGEAGSWDSSYFNTTSASGAGTSYSHIYWWLHGPNDTPSGVTDYNWGKQQATAAGNAWYGDGGCTWAPYAYGKTFFADIEYSGSTYYGWRTDGSSASKTRNQKVLEGWLDGIAGYLRSGYNPGFIPGFYTRPNIWSVLFGTSYKTPRGGVLWISGCKTNCSNICSPCSNNCSTTLTDVANAFPSVAGTILGGNKSVVWQYWIDCSGNCGCGTNGDWDATQQSGYQNFSPVTSSTAYSITGCSC